METQSIESESSSESTNEYSVPNENNNNTTETKEKIMGFLEIKAGLGRIDKSVLLELYLKLKKIFFPQTCNTKDLKKCVRLAFHKKKPEDLCEKLEYFCCDENVHSARCLYK